MLVGGGIPVNLVALVWYLRFLLTFSWYQVQFFSTRVIVCRDRWSGEKEFHVSVSYTELFSSSWVIWIPFIFVPKGMVVSRVTW